MLKQRSKSCKRHDVLCNFEQLGGGGSIGGEVVLVIVLVEVVEVLVVVEAVGDIYDNDNIVFVQYCFVASVLTGVLYIQKE